MHSFYIEKPVNGMAVLPLEDAKHALKVLRLRPGDEICAMDGMGHRWRAALAEAAEDVSRVTLLEALPDHEPPVHLTLYQGLPKADKLDFIAQKLTELGASALTPVRMERCVTRLDSRDGEKRRERLEKIAREAAKQCARSMPPRMNAPMDWKAALKDMAAHDLLLIPWEEADGTRLQDVLQDVPRAWNIGVVIGPEGGMTPGEVEAMRNLGGRVVTMGPRILRTETAALAAAVLIMQLWGDI